MYMTVPTATCEVYMNFLQYRWIMWGGAVVIVLVVVALWYGWMGSWPGGWLGGETPPAQ